MKLLCLEDDRIEVTAIIDERIDRVDECPVLKFIEDQPKNLQASAIGFRVLFRRYAQKGRQGLTGDSVHEADKLEGIWRFRKGKLRIYYFADNSKSRIILTHGALKKTQKAAKKEVSEAARTKERYQIEKKGNDNIVVITEEEWANEH